MLMMRYFDWSVLIMARSFIVSDASFDSNVMFIVLCVGVVSSLLQCRSTMWICLLVVKKTWFFSFFSKITPVILEVCFRLMFFVSLLLIL